MAGKGKRGRKPKYSQEVQDRIVTAIKMGCTFELAANYGGISTTTFYEWINTNPDFADAIKGAEGQAAVNWLTLIEKAALPNEDGTGGSWQAAAWKLERRYPQQYGRQIQEVQGAGGGDFVVKVLRGVSMDDI
jgi:transposase